MGLRFGPAPVPFESNAASNQPCREHRDIVGRNRARGGGGGGGRGGCTRTWGQFRPTVEPTTRANPKTVFGHPSCLAVPGAVTLTPERSSTEPQKDGRKGSSTVEARCPFSLRPVADPWGSQSVPVAPVCCAVLCCAVLCCPSPMEQSHSSQRGSSRRSEGHRWRRNERPLPPSAKLARGFGRGCLEKRERSRDWPNVGISTYGTSYLRTEVQCRECLTSAFGRRVVYEGTDLHLDR